MATSLETRVRQLEGGTGGRCPECGFDGDRSKLRYVIEDHSPGESNEYCGTCGRPKRIVLTWRDKV